MLYEAAITLKSSGRQQNALATITAHNEGAKHNQDRYVFNVNGRQYTGWLSPHGQIFPLGAEVFIYYDPQDPSRNSLSGFSTEVLQYLLLAFLMIVVALAVAKSKPRNR
jgi:hypothetical protein